MDFEAVAERLDGVPYMPVQNGRMIYDWVLDQQPHDVLEIGFHHGVSTCYIAAALDELGRGHITTIDLESARSKDPSLLQLLDGLDLHRWVTPVFAERSFTWELRRLLAADPRPMFDFVFHDADHTWDSTVIAFYLADKMLRPGGWMLFDDYPYTIANSSISPKSRRGRYPEEEKQVPAVAEAFRLLIDEHPSYGGHALSPKGGWGWTQKREELVPASQARGRSRVWPLLAGAVGGFAAGRARPRC